MSRSNWRVGQDQRKARAALRALERERNEISRPLQDALLVLGAQLVAKPGPPAVASSAGISALMEQARARVATIEGELKQLRERQKALVGAKQTVGDDVAAATARVAHGAEIEHVGAELTRKEQEHQLAIGEAASIEGRARNEEQAAKAAAQGDRNVAIDAARAALTSQNTDGLDPIIVQNARRLLQREGEIQAVIETKQKERDAQGPAVSLFAVVVGWLGLVLTVFLLFISTMQSARDAPSFMWAAVAAILATYTIAPTFWWSGFARIGAWAVTALVWGQVTYAGLTAPTVPMKLTAVLVFLALAVGLALLARRARRPGSVIAFVLLLLAIGGVQGHADFLQNANAQAAKIKDAEDRERDARFAEEKRLRIESTLTNYANLVAEARNALNRGDTNTASPALHLLAEAKPDDADVKALQRESDFDALQK